MKKAFLLAGVSLMALTAACSDREEPVDNNTVVITEDANVTVDNADVNVVDENVQ